MVATDTVIVSWCLVPAERTRMATRFCVSAVQSSPYVHPHTAEVMFGRSSEGRNPFVRQRLLGDEGRK
jgi:hypothetical protein